MSSVNDLVKTIIYYLLCDIKYVSCVFRYLIDN